MNEVSDGKRDKGTDIAVYGAKKSNDDIDSNINVGIIASP